MLQISDGAGHSVAASSPPSDVDSVIFTPNFFSPASPPRNGGVTVDTATGRITVDTTLPSSPLRNFVVEATVKTKPSSSRTLTTPVALRVWVHDAIQGLWLTPSALTIHQGADGLRFTVLAAFAGTWATGDITYRPGIAWSSGDTTLVQVDPATGALTANTSSATGVPITAQHGGRTAKALVNVESAWSTPVAAKLVPGGAGRAKIDEVPNFLVLPDGFKASERPQFEALVRELIDRLHTTPSLRPYDLFRGAVNYWSAFMPSRERGTSVLPELVVRLTIDETVTINAEAIPLPVKPSGGSYTLANLIYEAGLPGAEYPETLLDLVGLYGAHLATVVSPEVFAQWRDLNDYVLADERDTALGVAQGQRPSLAPNLVTRSYGFHPLRTTPAHLDQLLANVTDGSGGPTLPRWAPGGRDRGRVIVLLGGGPYAGTAGGGAIFASLADRADVLAKWNDKQFELLPWPLPAHPSLEVVSLAAHELGHGHGLADEYGEHDELRIPAAAETWLRAPANVQAASDLTTSAADQSPLDRAKLGKIKWLWPRIDAAGVLAARPVPDEPPDPAPAEFYATIPLQRGHARFFAPNDIVRLRRRPLVGDGMLSERLHVEDVDVANDRVGVFSAEAINPDMWPPGTVLIRPVRGAPAPADSDGPDLPLVAPIIQEHLAQSGRPLDLSPLGLLPPPCAKDDDRIQVPRNLPTGLPAGRPRYRAQIVGLYDGGSQYYCGVYHPSGVCLMRGQQLVPGEKRTYLLCPVCRYALVDRLDPTMHAVIEADYRNRYPQP